VVIEGGDNISWTLCLTARSSRLQGTNWSLACFY
jgi:hypothetical protein